MPSAAGGLISPCYRCSGTVCSADIGGSGAPVGRRGAPGGRLGTDPRPPRSKTDPEAEGAVLYIGEEAALALQWILPEDVAVAEPAAPVFGLSASQIGRRVERRGEGRGPGRRLRRPQRAVWAWPRTWRPSGVELPALMNAGRWKSSQYAGEVH